MIKTFFRLQLGYKILPDMKIHIFAAAKQNK